MPGRALYRAWQFLRALGARWTPMEQDTLAGYLTPWQQALFHDLPANDQRHSLAVFHALQRAGHTNRELLQAALLHDVGKLDSGLRLWHRVSIVLLEAIRPELLDRLARGDPRSWRYPFFVHRHHAARGAELVQQAGASPLVVELVRHHQTAVPPKGLPPPVADLLRILQAVDGMC